MMVDNSWEIDLWNSEQEAEANERDYEASEDAKAERQEEARQEALMND